ncbi:unnamed protein product [Closterium sp. NIES-53]
MATPRVLRFDAEAADPTPADSDRYARERADVTAWKSCDAAVCIALSSLLPKSEETHFTQRTADLITHLRSLNSSYCAACTDAQLALLPPPMAITIYFIATSLPDRLASVLDALLLKHPGELTIEVLESALKDVESNLCSVASASGVVSPPLFHGRGSQGAGGGGGGSGGDVASGGGGSAGAGGAPCAAAGDSNAAAGGGDARVRQPPTGLPAAGGGAAAWYLTQRQQQQPLPSQQPQQQQELLRRTLRCLSLLTLELCTFSSVPTIGFGVGLVLGGRRDVVLTGHCDSSYTDDSKTHRSTQGYCFSLGSGAVSWRSTRSSSVSTSTADAEIYPGAMAAQELHWLTFLLTDLGEWPSSAPTLFTDNKSRGQAHFDFVESEANTADIFTKALPPCDHQRCCVQLGLLCFFVTGLVTVHFWVSFMNPNQP